MRGRTAVIRLRRGLTLCAAALALAFAAAPAEARDPGRWLLTGWSSVSLLYWQGMTSDPRGNLFFDGISEGLYRTAISLRQTAGVDQEIPAAVKATEGYNHIGDISWHPAEDGRVLLPLECYTPGQGIGGNTCLTGSIGVADPAFLAFRYYVKLDPAEIAKAMWVESSPDGRLLWTSSGADLLAYSALDVSPAHAAPVAPPIHSVSRLAGATPPSGITGATFLHGRLFVAGQDAAAGFQVWSLDPGTGARRLEIEMPVKGESEGLHAMRLRGGRLHWLIAPLAQKPTFGRSVAVLHFVRAHGRPGLRVRVQTRRRAGLRLRIRVTRRGRPVARARVRFAGRRGRTGRRGRALLRLNPLVGGRFRVVARSRGRRGLSRLVTVESRADAAGESVPALAQR
jgi:hypothetical protein